MLRIGKRWNIYQVYLQEIHCVIDQMKFVQKHTLLLVIHLNKSKKQKMLCLILKTKFVRFLLLQAISSDNALIKKVF